MEHKIEHKLDNLSKILLATSAINQMAASLYQVTENFIAIDAINTVDPNKEYPAFNKNIANESILFNQKFMSEMVKDLSSIMEDFGNFINDCGITCEIDQRILKVPFEILVDGKDEIENLYDE